MNAQQELSSAWEIVSHILEVMGIFFIPFVGWTLVTIVNHSKQIIVLESKVNDSLDRRMMSLENKVQNLEYKIDKKIDAIEANVTDCKLSINNLIVEKFDHLVSMVEARRSNDKQNN
jgi:hypothetical protein